MTDNKIPKVLEIAPFVVKRPKLARNTESYSPDQLLKELKLSGAPEILLDESAVQQSGIPQLVDSELQAYSTELRISYSIRSNQIGIPPSQQFFKGNFTPKGTPTHTKSVKRICPNTGHVVKLLHDPGKARNLTDHADGSFPLDAKPMAINMAIDAALLEAQHNEKVLEIKEDNGRLYYKIERDAYRYAEEVEAPGTAIATQADGKKYVKIPGKRQTEYYAQEIESLRTVLSMIEADKYKYISLNSSNLRYADEQGHIYELDLSKLNPVTPIDIKLWQAQPQPIPDYAIPEELQRFISENNLTGRIDEIAPVSNVVNSKVAPNLVICGYRGTTTGDFDLCHMGFVADMPDDAYRRLTAVPHSVGL